MTTTLKYKNYILEDDGDRRWNLFQMRRIEKGKNEGKERKVLVGHNMRLETDIHKEKGVIDAIARLELSQKMEIVSIGVYQDALMELKQEIFNHHDILMEVKA